MKHRADFLKKLIKLLIRLIKQKERAQINQI